MDSDTVAFATLCFCFFFFFFFFILPLGGVGFYFFIVKKKDTSEEKTRSLSCLRNETSQSGIPLFPLYPIVPPPLEMSVPFDISKNEHFNDSKVRLERLEEIVSDLQKEKKLREKKVLEEKKAL